MVFEKDCGVRVGGVSQLEPPSLVERTGNMVKHPWHVMQQWVLQWLCLQYSEISSFRDLDPLTDNYNLIRGHGGMPAMGRY